MICASYPSQECYPSVIQDIQLIAMEKHTCVNILSSKNGDVQNYV